MLIDGRGNLADAIFRELFGNELSRRVRSVVEERFDVFGRLLLKIREVGGRDSAVTIKSLKKIRLFYN